MYRLHYIHPRNTFEIELGSDLEAVRRYIASIFTRLKVKRIFPIEGRSESALWRGVAICTADGGLYFIEEV